MTVLVTGAAGFLGRHVVAALTGAGYHVRRLVRSTAGSATADGAADTLHADLRTSNELEAAVAGVAVVVHLAAAMRGSETERAADTLIGTKRLFRAAARAGVRRLVLCSSLAVYDRRRARGTLDEQAPLAHDPRRRGAYAALKLGQERLARQLAARAACRLTILRPGFIWGRGRACAEDALGWRLGPLQLVVGPGRELPLSHVRNCADAVRAVVADERASGRIFNLVDDHAMTAWALAGACLRQGRFGLRVALPAAVVLGASAALEQAARFAFGRDGRLARRFRPERFRARFGPERFSNASLCAALDWQPPLDRAACLEATFGPLPGRVPGTEEPRPW